MVAPDPQSHRHSNPYRGRFAPSPTGPLHIGSVVAALASYLDARSHGGTWLVRIEDLDPLRELPGAADQILRTLEHLGLEWDESIEYQSQRSEAYEAALEDLATQDLLYHCHCSRSELSGNTIYPGTCRNLAHPEAIAQPSALRCKVFERTCQFEDRLQGHYQQRLNLDVGDFVVRRKDSYYAYQLAVVVDDAWQQITDVVRGIDLLDSTPRQLYLQHCLRLHQPRYAHIPIVLNQLGQKLGKQQFAPAVSMTNPTDSLITALILLAQQPPSSIQKEPAPIILQWAIEHWQPQRLQGIKYITE